MYTKIFARAKVEIQPKKQSSLPERWELYRRFENCKRRRFDGLPAGKGRTFEMSATKLD